MLLKSLNLSHKLAECVHACNDCLNACLEEENVKMMKECIRIDRECAIICGTTLELIHAHSHFTKEILSLCEKACKACAEECGKFPHDHCQECAKACNECARACREFML